ncbi:MAG: C40 family peptidase [Clostridium sp.]|uniref:C40 family peptidase n=1 Tax=Clostridium sp. TaxID=1506 RepID=UPI003D6D17DF
MRTSFSRKKSLRLWPLISIIIILTLVYMIFTIFSNSKNPLRVDKDLTNGEQYSVLIDGNDITMYSDTFLGTNYLWGGTTPAVSDSTGKYISGGFDCSGFVQYTYKHFDIDLPRTSMDQINKGISISINDLKNGDLVFFKTNPALPNQVSHVGIYIGNNEFIHSPKSGEVIKTSELTGYYKERFVIGKRIIK